MRSHVLQTNRLEKCVVTFLLLNISLFSDGDLPVLMSRAELAIQESLNSKGPVSNPPPSPATDTRGDSSNDSPLASPVCYEDDVLDVYADTMEQF